MTTAGPQSRGASDEGGIQRPPGARVPEGRAPAAARGGGQNPANLTSVVLVGPRPWRDAVARLLATSRTLGIAAALDADLKAVGARSVPRGDVFLIAADGAQPNIAIECAMRVQSEQNGAGVAVVLPRMSAANLGAFHAFAGSWSLVSAATCGDPARLGQVLESAGQGIAWVDPVVQQLFETLYGVKAVTGKEAIEAAVSGLAQEARSSPEAAPAEAALAGPQKSRVLVVDDGEDVRLALQAILEDAGHDVMEAKNGAEAVELAHENPPDAVLLDVMMPVMDGMEALKRLKADPKTQRVPVIMVSAKGGRNDMEQARRLGAFDYIAKPWMDGEVEMSVHWAVSRSRTTR